MFEGFKLQKAHIIVLAVIVALILLLYISTKEETEGSNKISLAADQTSGEAPFTVNFTVITTATHGPITEYRWDFDGDGNIDETIPTNTVSHTYSQPGIFKANAKVVAN